MNAKTAQPTPGPWSMNRKFVVGPVDQSDDQSNGMVIGVADVYGENREADARLIAAAPDMLAVLNDIAAFLTWNECSQATPQVRMSKADISNALDHAILSARAAISKAVQS